MSPITQLEYHHAYNSETHAPTLSTSTAVQPAITTLNSSAGGATGSFVSVGIFSMTLSHCDNNNLSLLGKKTLLIVRL